MGCKVSGQSRPRIEDSEQKETERYNVEKTKMSKCPGTLGVNLHLVKFYRSLTENCAR
jgi:hypothetical protein